MCSKPRPTIIATISTDLSGHVDKFGDIAAAALKDCQPVPEGCRLVVYLGAAKLDTRNVIGRAWSEEFIGWHRAAEIELTGSDPEFVHALAAGLGRAG